MLLAETKEKFSRLQEDGNDDIYFVDQADKKNTIDDPFTFNNLLKKVKPNEDDDLALSLLVRIKG